MTDATDGEDLKEIFFLPVTKEQKDFDFVNRMNEISYYEKNQFKKYKYFKLLRFCPTYSL